MDTTKELEVLVSCMNESDDIIKKLNLQSDSIIVNQIPLNMEYSSKFIQTDSGEIRWFNTPEKGLSRSRNFALNKCSSKYAILCDDDVKYRDDYRHVILSAFAMKPEADVLIFDINDISSNNGEISFRKLKLFNSMKYGSVRIAFNVSSIKKHGIVFNENFGTGSIYAHGEDSIFLSRAFKNKLKVFKVNRNLGSLDTSNSTWFKGYDKKFYFDKGAIWSKISNPFVGKLLSIAHVARHPEEASELTKIDKVRLMFAGINAERKNTSFEEYYQRRDG